MSESSAIATFLAARKHPRRNIDRLMSIIRTVDAWVMCSVRWTTKSLAAIFTGTFGPSRTIELRLEAVHLLQPLHQAHRLAHAQRVLAEERIPLAQLGGRHHRLHESGKARQLEAQRVVLEQSIHHLAQLLARLWAHALEQR